MPTIQKKKKELDSFCAQKDVLGWPSTRRPHVNHPTHFISFFILFFINAGAIWIIHLK